MSPAGLLKGQAWRKRYADTGVQYNLTLRTELKKMKIKDLLSHRRNKELLCRLLATRAISQLGQKQYVIAYDQIIHSNIPEWSTATHTHIEADTLIICLVRELADLRAGSLIRILSPDTDVLVLSVYLTAIDCTSAVIEFELLNAKARRIIPVTAVSDKLGQVKSQALLAAYILTGCDQIGKFNTISKDRAFKIFMTLPSPVIQSLAKLGDDFDISMTSDVGKAVSSYVMLLYATRQDDRAHLKKMNDIGDLRWRLYSKHQTETEKLPPTPSTLNRHVQRVNFVLRLWKLSTETFRPQLPDIKDHGWTIEEDRLCPIMMDELPAPEYCIDMIHCNCKATKCATGHCSCKKNNLGCTDLCNCEECENCEDLATDVQFDDEDDNEAEGDE